MGESFKLPGVHFNRMNRYNGRLSYVKTSVGVGSSRTVLGFGYSAFVRKVFGY